MFHRDPILIQAPLGRIYAFTRYYRGDNFFNGPRLAFPHDRGFARERLLSLSRHVGDDPFNDRLHDVWQMVFQKPWTRPRSLHELVMDLTDKITRGELFVYEERDPDRAHRIPVNDGPPEGGAAFDMADLQGDQPPMGRPRVSGPPVAKTASWGSDYADGLSDTASAMASDIASEQTELYENTSGWGNVMYPIFKPVENAGRFVGNTVGLLSGLSPNGMKPEVAQYWKDMGEGFQALGDRIVDAVGGDGRAAGEITPAVASILVTKNVPRPRFRSLDGLNTLRGSGNSVGDFSGVKGMAVEEIVSNVPSDASVRKLRPVEGKSQVGLEFKWTDENGITNRLRIHDPDPSHPGSNAANGWVARWQRSGGYYDPGSGSFAHRNAHNPNSPNSDPEAANNTHTPIETPEESLANLMKYQVE